MSEQLFFLDAQTYDGKNRLTSFASELDDVIPDFMRWVDDIGIKPKDIWYADIFDSIDEKHLASVVLREDGNAEIHVAPSDSKLNPYKRRSFISKIFRRKR